MMATHQEGAILSRLARLVLPRPTEAHSRQYKLFQTIGNGVFAKAKLAEHLPTGREVAIKVIDKASGLNSQLKGKIYREVQTMKTLNHPNIVKLFQVMDTPKKLYLVMEYASGGDLDAFLSLRAGGINEDDSRPMFRQLISAVQYCHQKRIVHRDLKLANILLDSELNIKIADFGFSNEFTPGSKLETFCGSPPYAAPEIFQNRKYDGPKVDVWSLGVILYRLLTGNYPFDGESVYEIAESVIAGKYSTPDDMSVDCKNLLRQFFVLDPAERSNLETIMVSKWLNIGYKDDQLQPFIEPEADLKDPKRIEAILAMGYDRQGIDDSLSQVRCDEIYATYWLLDSKGQILRYDDGLRPGSETESSGC